MTKRREYTAECKNEDWKKNRSIISKNRKRFGY
ncbi:hypothetical protein Wcon_00996 [Wolbachia endosymbiont of Cylisticus convexus]|nr:hypothetical protein Wcon_00996 [Wolbachia endosymbiont of Cylisticus convexus]